MVEMFDRFLRWLGGRPEHLEQEDRRPAAPNGQANADVSRLLRTYVAHNLELARLALEVGQFAHGAKCARDAASALDELALPIPFFQQDEDPIHSE